MRRSILYALLLGWPMLSTALGANPDLLTKGWGTAWIYVPDTSPTDYGVYHFRRTFELAQKPDSFVVHVSGDNRYQLFVNGERVVWGPARGDRLHWRYETVDIAPQLRTGNNVLAAVVWNFGLDAPVAQISYRSAFLLQGDTAAEQVVNTGPHWKCTVNQAYRPVRFDNPMKFYYVAGPGDEVDGSRYPWGWEQPGFDDSSWQSPGLEDPAAPRLAQDAHSHWMLVPRPIPLMEERSERLSRVRQASGVQVPANFPAQPARVEIPAGSKARLLLDQNWLTTAYPELIVSGGANAVIRLRYAESLWVRGTREKRNRDEVEGKELSGYSDVFRPDGGAQRLFRPLWWRTYRYIELTAETKGEPLVIEDLRGIYTGYPLVRRARFDAGSEELTRILDVGWRSARLCAHETYMDTPYYEQLQYVGDTRIQSLVSLYNSGDARLMRNAIDLINDSRTAEGATFSRAPSSLQQYIPGFSLWWIGMVHDYWMYQDDPKFVKEMLPGVRAVLSFFGRHHRPDGLLGVLPWWNNLDWVPGWEEGMPPRGKDGASAPHDLQLLLAYQWATQLENALGSKALAGEYQQAAGRLRSAIQKLYWDSERGLFADTTDKTHYSQHANALAVLAGVVEGDVARSAMERTLQDRSLAQTTIYFSFYLNCALHKAGLGDRYLERLKLWRDILALGLTTWPEQPEPTRSDCHAWGASPNFEIFRTVLGIDTAAPGFRRVVVRPHLGNLTKVSGAIPHPNGEVAVSLDLKGGQLTAEVTLPEGTEGDFVWRGVTRTLKAGKNNLTF